MTSIIIPAHNEEKVIERCLQTFVNSIEKDELEVIVVCNGCTDKTAQIVSKTSDKIICIETERASKANALNIGDEVAKTYPRFYVDSDISISMEAISAIVRVLKDRYMAASPEIEMNLSESSWIVKSYYQVWLSLPYCKAGMIGAGMYALSYEGRKRFNKFPEIISDDGYVRCLFNESERGAVHGHYSKVNAPRNLPGLIKIKTRSRLGRYELIEKYPELVVNENKDYLTAIKHLMMQIKLWPKIFLYIAINIFTRVRALWQKKKNMHVWERDNSSRYV